MRDAALFAEKSLRQLRRDGGSTTLTLVTTPLSTALYGAFARGEASAPGVRSFDATVPGLLVFSVIMIVFSSSMQVAREVESGAMERMRTWPTSPLALLSGTSLVQLALAALSTGLTLAAAWLMGFESRGSIAAIFALAVLGAGSSIGLGVAVCAVTRTQYRAFLVGSVVMFLLLLFSGVVFPRPHAALLTVSGVAVGPFDLLPTTHLHEALSRALSGASFAEVAPRAAALAVTSLAYFAVGVVLFRHRHFREVR